MNLDRHFHTSKNYRYLKQTFDQKFQVNMKLFDYISYSVDAPVLILAITSIFEKLPLCKQFDMHLQRKQFL